MDENNELTKFTVWGVLQCFRFMIIHLAELDKSSSQSSQRTKSLFSPSSSIHQFKQSSTTTATTAATQGKKSNFYFSLLNLCQIYEICIFYLNNEDNRIVTASLECLQVLLKLCPFKFNSYLTETGYSNNSFLRNKVLALSKRSKQSSGYESGFSTMSASSLSLSSHGNNLSSSMDSLNTLKPSNASINDSDARVEDHGDISQITEDVDLNAQILSSPNKLIGSFYDKDNPPILYLIRLLSYKFLLNSTDKSANSKLKSDQDIKILVKSTALECCSSALSLCPRLIFKSLFINFDDQIQTDFNTNLYISDLIEYVNHPDDKMRSTTLLLIGQFINSVLIKNTGDYDTWLSENSQNKSEKIQNFNNLKIEILIDYLMKFIGVDNQKQTNNICKRFSLSSFRSFLPALVKTRHSSYSLEILINLIHLKHSTYNLVKCELVDLIASIDFKSISYIEHELVSDSSKSFLEDCDDDLGQQKHSSPFLVRDTQERIIEEVYLYLLGSDDSKVRLETARSLTRFVLNMNFFELSSIPNQNFLLSAGEHALKSEGYATNFLNSSLIDNDALNLSSISYLFDKNKMNLTNSSSSSSSSVSSSFVTPASILHGSSGTSSKRQIRYSCSPLSSVSFLSSLPWLSKTNQILINNFVQPFHSLIKHWPSKASNTSTVNNSLNKIVEHNLAYLVPVLVKTMIKSLDKYQFLGCLETLDFLFQTYQPALFYASSIGSNNVDSNNSQQLVDLLNLLINYLKHPNVAFDLYAHDVCLRLIGNLFSSFCWLNMKRVDKNLQQLSLNLNNLNQIQANLSQIQNLLDLLNNKVKSVPLNQSQAELSTGLTYTYSFSFNNQQLKPCIDSLFVHVMRLMCVLACVIDETALPANLTSNLSAGSTAVNAPPQPPPLHPTMSNPGTQTTLNPPSTPTGPVNPTSVTASPSFIRSKLTNLTDGSSKLAKNSAVLSQSPQKESQSEQLPQVQTSLPKTSNNVHLGYFQNSCHYLKLYELARVAFNSYKKSANINSYDRFTQMIKTTLGLFAQLLESSLSVQELGPHLDEILLYLRVIFNIDPSGSVKCVTLCLKSLFSLNLAGLMFEYVQQQVNKATSSISGYNQTSSLQNTNLQIPVPISGLSSVLSTSLSSLTSFNQPVPFSQLNSWSTNSKRHQTSIFSSLLQNHLAQFTRFMYSQTLMFKNENLIGIQFNPNSNLLNLGLDSIEYMSNPSLSTGPTLITSSSQSTLLTVNQAPVTPTAHTTASLTSKTVSKITPFSTGFNLFNFMKKPKQESANPPLANSPVQQPQQQQQQQQQASQQDQKSKQQKTDLKTIGQYIKSFESIVIKSLRQYTLTTSVNLQTKILELLTQLIFLKVDYFLLDSDKVFIDYILKQFEYLEQKRPDELSEDGENGANLLARSYLTDLNETFDSESSLSDALNPFDLDTMLNKLYSSLESSSSSLFSSNSGTSSGQSGSGSSSYGSLNSPLTSNLSLKQQEHQRTHVLIPKLFDFLILLSHEKKTSQSVSPVKVPQQKLGRYSGLLTIPEIMQLCDNLIASENSPHTHAIPALRPLVIDLFLNRTNEDSRELDMQHDVIMMTMMRLVHYPQVWPLFTIAVLKFKRDSEEKWKKSSRQICDGLFDSMRSLNPSLRIKFFEYNGNELRAVRRYSQSYIPSIESVKQLFQLLNSLAPQVFRPIDFIILSMFETLKPMFVEVNIKNVNCNELSNYLCLMIVHVYLLLANSTEDQLLIRLHHLTPQIVASYKEAGIGMSSGSGKIKRAKLLSERAESKGSSVNSSRKSSMNLNDDENGEEIRSSMSSRCESEILEDSANNSASSSSSSYCLDSDDFDLTDSALFLSKFFLRVFELTFLSVRDQIRFNSNMYFSAQNLASTSSTAFLRDSEINAFRDLNLVQHLISNKLMFLLYISSSGNYPKLADAFTHLIDDKNKGKIFLCNKKNLVTLEKLYSLRNCVLLNQEIKLRKRRVVQTWNKLLRSNSLEDLKQRV